METLTLRRPAPSPADQQRDLMPDEVLEWAWSIRADPGWLDELDDVELLEDLE